MPPIVTEVIPFLVFMHELELIRPQQRKTRSTTNRFSIGKTAQNFQNHQNLQYETVSTA
jgi:hypothetical protein